MSAAAAAAEAQSARGLQEVAKFSMDDVEQLRAPVDEYCVPGMGPTFLRALQHPGTKRVMLVGTGGG